MDITEQLPTVVSFCSGYAGIERGLNLAGVRHRVVAYVEIEAFAIANLVAKMEAGELAPAPIWSNLKTFPAHLFRGAVDIITGGYPCQPFSTAGKRAGADDPRHLWPIIRRHTQAIRPARVFFENVEGHISLGLSSVISDLEEDGYSATWGIFSAREVGAPHQRKRVFIMGDSQHDGSPTSEKRGSDETAYQIGREEKSNTTGQFTRTGQPSDGASSERSKGRSEWLHSGGIRPTSGNSATPNLADSNSKGLQWSEGTGGTSKKGQSDRHATDSRAALPDTISERLEGHAGHGKDCDQSRWLGEKEKRPVSKGSLCNREPNIWPPEPRLGRVVDGCPNRVDRIRLLGNGVVPQTAAKAWQVLDARFNDE